MLDTVVYGNVSIFDLLTALEIVLVIVLIVKIATLNLRRYLKNKVAESTLANLIKTVTYISTIVGLIAVLPILGINPAGFLVAGGIIAIIIGFASQSIVSNLISGIFLIIERPVNIGDTVHVQDTLGTIEDVRILSTLIRTFDGVLVRIPNDTVFTSKITNYIAHVVRRFGYTVGIPYKDDADIAASIIKNVIDAHPLALVKPAPQVYVDELGDNSVDLKIRIWAPASDWWDVRIELLWKIKKALAEEGIHVPFPQHELWFNEPIRVRTEGANTEPPSAEGSGGN